MESAPAARPSRFRTFDARRDSLFLGVALVIVTFDQLTKWIIRQTIDRGDGWPAGWEVQIVHYRNSGAAFGVFQDAGPLLVIASLAGMAAILIYLFSPGFQDPLMRVGLALMLGGAVGNLIDRVYAGEVVDFISVWHWPAFNVADSAITIGVLLLLWVFMRSPDSKTAES